MCFGADRLRLTCMASASTHGLKTLIYGDDSIAPLRLPPRRSNNKGLKEKIGRTMDSTI